MQSSQRFVNNSFSCFSKLIKCTIVIVELEFARKRLNDSNFESFVVFVNEWRQRRRMQFFFSSFVRRRMRFSFFFLVRHRIWSSFFRLESRRARLFLVVFVLLIARDAFVDANVMINSKWLRRIRTIFAKLNKLFKTHVKIAKKKEDEYNE
jgi:hypothetical protein